MHHIPSNEQISGIQLFSFRCLFGFHDYQRQGKRSGMALNDDGEIVGTMRWLYRCKRCAILKPADYKDYF